MPTAHQQFHRGNKNDVGHPKADPSLYCGGASEHSPGDNIDVQQGGVLPEAEE